MQDKIRPQTIAEAVVERILADISAGELQPGQRMPAQRELAQHLGVSMSSVREALQSLQTMGAIDIRHGVGAFVQDPAQIRPMYKSGGWSMPPNPRQIEEVMEARCVVEIGVVRLAAEHATAEQIEGLSLCVAEMTRALSQNDGQLYSKHDARFHLLLAESSSNMFLSQFLQTLGDSLRSLFEFVPYSSAGLLHHGHIVEAVRRRSPDAAARAMARLMTHTVSILREHGDLTETFCKGLDSFLVPAEGGGQEQY